MLYLWVVIAFVDNLYLGQKTIPNGDRFTDTHKILKEPNDLENMKSFIIWDYWLTCNL